MILHAHTQAGSERKSAYLAGSGHHRKLKRLDFFLPLFRCLLFHAQQSSGNQCRSVTHLNMRSAQGCKKVCQRGGLSQRQPQRLELFRDRGDGVVAHARDLPAIQVKNGERFQNVVKLGAGEINLDFLVATNATGMLEISHAVLVQDHPPDGQFLRGALGKTGEYSKQWKQCCKYAVFHWPVLLSIRYNLGNSMKGTPRHRDFCGFYRRMITSPDLADHRDFGRISKNLGFLPFLSGSEQCWFRFIRVNSLISPASGDQTLASSGRGDRLNLSRY